MNFIKMLFAAVAEAVGGSTAFVPASPKLDELKAAFKTAKEAVDNELLAKYAGSKSAKKSENGTETATEKSQNVDDQVWPLIAAGKTNKEIEAETGIPRSTVWFSSDRYKKANG